MHLVFQTNLQMHANMINATINTVNFTCLLFLSALCACYHANSCMYCRWANGGRNTGANRASTSDCRKCGSPTCFMSTSCKIGMRSGPVKCDIMAEGMEEAQKDKDT